MCKWGNHKKVKVKIPADLSYTGKTRWKFAGIDECIAPIVRGLQRNKIDMRGSCCGHDKTDGSIDLQDGRVLLLLDKETAHNWMRFNHVYNVKKIINFVAWFLGNYKGGR